MGRSIGVLATGQLRAGIVEGATLAGAVAEACVALELNGRLSEQPRSAQMQRETRGRVRRHRRNSRSHSASGPSTFVAGIPGSRATYW